jgi:hypothetical protein
MLLSSWLTKWRRLAPRFHRHSPRRRRPDYGPPVEALECRTLLTAYAAATAAQLVADINAANKSGGDNTITLTAPTTSPYVLSAVNNSTDGPTALPVIKKGDNLTVVTGNGSTNPGFGDTIDAAGHGRLFDVAQGASLTLQNVTLQNGHVLGSGVSAEGGAVYNQGTLVLSEVMVQGNIAAGAHGTSSQNKPGGAGQDAAGGGIWSNGSLTLENATVLQDNTALGGDGGSTTLGTGPGGKAFGGGIDIAGGTANISGTTLGAYSTQVGNIAQGGVGDNTLDNLGGSAYGGAVYVAAGTVVMNGDTVGSAQFTSGYQTQNVAQSGAEANGYVNASRIADGGGLYVAAGSVTLTNDIIEGNVAGTYEYGQYIDGYGGGIYIASGATVYIDSFTLANTTYNSDSSGIYFGNTANIDGRYILLA